MSVSMRVASFSAGPRGPVQVAAPAMIAPLAGPTSLQNIPSAEIPDPAQIQKQKDSYARSLETQLKQGMEVLSQGHKEQTDRLHAQANTEKQRYNLALDQAVKAQELALSQQFNEQLMKLQQAAQVQRAELEQQANKLMLEYQQRKVQENFVAQQEGLQKQYEEGQQRLSQEFQKLMPGVTAAQFAQVPQVQPTYGAPCTSRPLPSMPGMAPPALPLLAGSPCRASQGPTLATYAAPPMPQQGYASSPQVMQYVPPGRSSVPVYGAPGGNSYVPPVAAPMQYVPSGGGSVMAPSRSPVASRGSSYVPPVVAPMQYPQAAMPPRVL